MATKRAILPFNSLKLLSASLTSILNPHSEHAIKTVNLFILETRFVI